MHEEQARSRIIAALQDGAGAQYALDERYSSKIMRPRCDDAGVIHFEIDRHPHVFGRKSKGMSSPGYDVIRAFHELRDGEIHLVHKEFIDQRVDFRALAEETVELFDLSGWSTEEATAILELADVESVRSRAEVAAREIDWRVDLEHMEHPFKAVDGQAYIELCIRVAAERVVRAWSEIRGDA